MRPSRSSQAVPLNIIPDETELARFQREVEALRVEYRRVEGRINYRRRRGYMFVGLLVLALAVALLVAVFILSPADWALNQTTRFTQMTTLVGLTIVTVPLAGWFARRYDRQRNRVRLARTRQQEILARLAQLDGLMGKGVRRRRRKRTGRRWLWRIDHPAPFSRPPLESMSTPDLEETADSLGHQLGEAQVYRALAYAHAWIIGGATVVLAFTLTLLGPDYLDKLLKGEQWAGDAGPDPLLFWLTLTVLLVVIGGIGTHRFFKQLKHAREYRDRLGSIERALWDSRVLLRERREKV